MFGEWEDDDIKNMTQEEKDAELKYLREIRDLKEKINKLALEEKQFQAEVEAIRGDGMAQRKIELKMAEELLEIKNQAATLEGSAEQAAALKRQEELEKALEHLGITAANVTEKFAELKRETSDMAQEGDRAGEQFFGGIASHLGMATTAGGDFITKLNVNIKICIIRDPLERFISAYENRILFHKDRKFYEYSVDKVLCELNNGNFRNRHFLPQTFFLGENLDYFTHVFKLNQLEQLCKVLEIFFNVDKIKIPHLQTGKNKKIKLSKYKFEKIHTIYKKDYISFGIKSGGCSGFQYILEPCNEPPNKLDEACGTDLCP